MDVRMCLYVCNTCNYACVIVYVFDVRCIWVFVCVRVYVYMEVCKLCMYVHMYVNVCVFVCI